MSGKKGVWSRELRCAAAHLQVKLTDESLNFEAPAARQEGQISSAEYAKSKIGMVNADFQCRIGDAKDCIIIW
nr:hypothetical protein CFP56_67813 [Quercus suber]